LKRVQRNIKTLLILLGSMLSISAHAQTTPVDSLPPDPARISVYTVQNLHFGAFTQGAIGGTVAISSTGTRTASGDVVLLNMGVSYLEAIFEVEGIAGTVVSILNGPNATLTGSNGGSMSMSIGSSTPSGPFSIMVSPPSRTQVRIGATLNVGAPASNPPGTYTGTFYVTFNQE
jgi:Domain of unknown function (DUF4402)